MEKKSNKGVVISLLIVIAVLIGSIAYMFISGMASFDVKKNNENKTEEKENDKNETNNIETTNVTETERNYFMNNIIPVFDEMGLTSTEYNKSSLSNEEKIWFAIQHDEHGSWEYGFSLKYLLETSQKYLGEAGIFEPQDIICSVDNKVIFEYDDEQQYFKKVGSHGHGGAIKSANSINSFVDGTITKENGEIRYATIKIRKSFGPVCDDICGPTPRYGVYGGKDVVSNEYLSDEDTKNHIENNPDLYPVHTYVFNYENGNYYLDSITIEK